MTKGTSFRFLMEKACSIKGPSKFTKKKRKENETGKIPPFLDDKKHAHSNGMKKNGRKMKKKYLPRQNWRCNLTEQFNRHSAPANAPNLQQMHPTTQLFFFLFFAHFYVPVSGQAVVTGVVPSSPRFLPSIFIAHKVQQSHCSSIFHRVLLTHALALSAS